MLFGLADHAACQLAIAFAVQLAENRAIPAARFRILIFLRAIVISCSSGVTYLRDMRSLSSLCRSVSVNQLKQTNEKY